MRYVFEAGAPKRRVMHVQQHDRLGEPLFVAICGADLPFNRSINAPFALGRRVCKHCLRRLS